MLQLRLRVTECARNNLEVSRSLVPLPGSSGEGLNHFGCHARGVSRRYRDARREPAAELARELGHLPLALEQAAGYIKASGISLENYLKLYRERREELWPNQPPPHDYRHTVTTTWAMAMDSLAKEEPAAADLLNLLAFLAPDDIPRDLLAKVIGDPLVLNRAIAALRHYSLITADDDSLSLHRLVQAVTRDRLSEEERGNYAAATVRLLNDAFPYNEDDPDTWPESARLLAHALAAANHAAEALVGKPA